MENNINEKDFLFTQIITGIKEIPYKTNVLLINNTQDNTLDLVYKKEENKIIKLPLNTINNISFETKVKMNNINKTDSKNQIDTNLLAAALFGGNPILQVASAGYMDNLFDSLSNNYNKVNYNSYYQISIKTIYNDEETELLFNSDASPEDFINEISRKD